MKSLTLAEVTQLLNSLRIPLSLVFTPLNLVSEKKKFFDSDDYNPQFKYKIIENKNKEIFETLLQVNEISDVDPRISDFYLELIQTKKEASDLMYSVGDNESVSELSAKKYRKPSRILFRNACRVLRGKLDSYKVLDNKKIPEQGVLNYSEISNVFSAVFKELGLEGWMVDKSKNIAKNGVKIGIKSKAVFVDPEIQRKAFDLRKTIVHEVGTHVLRAYNASFSGFEALEKPNISSYLDVEEGLAMWNEEDMGLLKLSSLRKIALLVWAIFVGEELSFRQLYYALLGFVPKFQAFDITYRVKRGLSDTSLPGIFAKDVLYFRGFRKVKKRLSEDQSLYSKLYAGKIGFKQVKWLEDGLIKKAAVVPGKAIFEKIFKEKGI